MDKFFCEQVVAPGIVVALAHSSDLSQSTWGVTVPHEYWQKRSAADVVARFNKYSQGNYPQIPYLEFTNGEEWKLRFGPFPTTVKPLCWLEDFLHSNSKAVPMTLWACSRRDGGRYYRGLLMWLPMIAKGASREFSREELLMENAGTQEQIMHSQAIHKWQLANPNWREWKCQDDPGHSFHFTLF